MDNINPYQLFKELGIPVGYFVNPKPGMVPFLVYYGAGTTNLKADNKVYAVGDRWNIELYVTRKDRALENRIEELLDSNEIVWEKGSDIYIDEEKVFMIPYYI